VSKARTEGDLSAQLDADLTDRLRELSDLKRAILDAPPSNRTVLLKALVALAYAHWEGYVKFAAQKYFEFVSVRRLPYSSLHQQFYVNSFLVRLGTFVYVRPSLQNRVALVRDVLEGIDQRFSYIHPDLISTGSNLNFQVLNDICLICGVDTQAFAEHEAFIDVILLKRRNSIAHGDDSTVGLDEIDSLVSTTIALMRTFKNELENRVYEKAYLRAPSKDPANATAG
jgi:hypothetical protein